MTLVSLINYARDYAPRKLLQIIERRDFRESSAFFLLFLSIVNPINYCLYDITGQYCVRYSMKSKILNESDHVSSTIHLIMWWFYQDSQYTLTLWNFRGAIGFRRCPTTGSPSWRIPWSCRSPSSRRTDCLWDDDICKEKERSKLKEILISNRYHTALVRDIKKERHHRYITRIRMEQ